MWWRKIFFDYICHNMNRFALFFALCALHEDQVFNIKPLI